MRLFTLPGEEKLKSSKSISNLFEKGKSLFFEPVRALYLITENTDSCVLKVAFSVSKRSFKRAVDRNLLKRRMREAYRKNKWLLMKELNENAQSIHVIFIYSVSGIEKYDTIENSIREILLKLKKRLN